MHDNFKIGLVQMNSAEDVAANVAQAEKLVREAAAGGAQLIVTPEYTNMLFDEMSHAVKLAVPQDEDPCLARMRALARELNVWIHVGSLAIKANDSQIYNRSFLLNANGDIVATYDKIHLFAVTLPNGEVHNESDRVIRGKNIPVVDTPFGRMGFCICYDLRFPEMFKAMADAGVEIVMAPAAYTTESGKATWRTFVNGRAVDNKFFVAAAAQCGFHGERECWGHSMMADPFGRVIARTPVSNPEIPDGTPGVAIGTVDRTLLKKYEQSYPVTQQRADSPFQIVSAVPVTPPAVALRGPSLT